MKRSTFPHASRGIRLALAFIALLLAAVTMPASAQNDLSVTAFLSPQGGCALTATENVTIRIFNFGSTLPAATSFNASYTINAGAPAVELITLAAPLTSNSTLNYTFTTQANLSAPGNYTFDATVSIAGDISPANNSFTGYVATNSASLGGTVVSSPPSGSSGTLTLSGNTGNVVQWEESDDGGLRWFVLSDESTNQSFANLRATASFRARVRNGTCADALSSIATVVP